MRKKKDPAPVPVPTLRAWRESLGLSRSRVASMIDALQPDQPPTDQATIAKWESGESRVRLIELKLLAELYGTTADRLLYDPGDHVTPELMKQAHKILTSKEPAALAAWLSSGEFLPDATPTAKK